MQPNRYTASTTMTGKQNRALKLFAMHFSPKAYRVAGRDWGGIRYNSRLRLIRQLSAIRSAISTCKSNCGREMVVQPYAGASYLNYRN